MEQNGGLVYSLFGEKVLAEVLFLFLTAGLWVTVCAGPRGSLSRAPTEGPIHPPPPGSVVCLLIEPVVRNVMVVREPSFTSEVVYWWALTFSRQRKSSVGLPPLLHFMLCTLQKRAPSHPPLLLRLSISPFLYPNFALGWLHTSKQLASPPPPALVLWNKRRGLPALRLVLRKLRV